ncbi:MAG TPA: hypothetical protein VFM48_06310 [Aquabacterium sp.]|nr:hypothetical protein [Aquabacterium sp.]
MIPHRLRWTVCLGATALISACSSCPPHTVYRSSPGSDVTYDYDTGWRIGVVRAVGATQDIPATQQWDCRNTARPRLEQQFAMVRIKRDGLSIDRVVPLNGLADVRAGQKVIVNIKSCQPPVLIQPSTEN